MSGNLTLSGNLTAAVNALFVNAANGRVGIGTLTPTHTLTVNGDVNLNNSLYLNKTTGNVGINTTSPSNTLHVNGTFLVQTLAGITGLFQNALGNVGIGTTTPNQKLTVVGNMNLTGNLTATNITAASFETYTGKRLDNVEESYSYLIYTDGTTIYAKNGSTGKIDYMGADATVILNSVSGTVFFKNGTYNFSGLTTLKSDMYLSGESEAILSYGGDNDGYLFYSAGRNIKIHDLSFNGRWYEKAGTTYAILFLDTEDSSFQNLKIYNWTGGGIYLKGSTLGGVIGKNKIESNTLYNLGYPAIEIGLAGGGLNKGIHENVITNNIMYNLTRAGIRIWYSNGNIISGNHVNNTGTEGIDVIQGNQTIISNNYVRGGNKGTVSNECIFLSGASDGNPANPNDYNVVSNNICEEVRANGIKLVNAKHNIVTGNVLKNIGQNAHNTYTAIWLAQDGSSSSSFNIVANNDIHSAGAIRTANGILEDTLSNSNLVTNNIILNMASSAVTKMGALSSFTQNYGASPYNFGNKAIAPTAFGAGDAYYNTNTNRPCYYNGTHWNYYNNNTSGC